MINIPAASLKEASKLLNRVRFTRATLSALSHVLATTDQTGVTLAVTDLDCWLETRIPTAGPCEGPETFLIPADALAAALKADKDGTVSFARKGPQEATTRWPARPSKAISRTGSRLSRTKWLPR